MEKSIIECRRKELNISRENICKELGICLKTYYFYVIRQKPIPSDKLIALARILDCSVDYLLGLKKYTNITVVDDTGVLVADISHNRIAHGSYSFQLCYREKLSFYHYLIPYLQLLSVWSFNPPFHGNLFQKLNNPM